MARRVRGRRSWSVRAGTRKMVNYARVGRSPEETLVEVRSGSDVQIDRQTWV